MMKRIVCLALTAVMLLGLLPLEIYASAASATVSMRDLEEGETYQVMSTSQQMLDIIKDFEGFRATPYEDNSQWTVGYGSYAGDINDPKPDMNLTEDEAEELLREQIVSYENTVNDYCKKIGKQPSQQQFDALVDLTYNVGGSWTSGTSVPDVLENEVDALTFVKGLGAWSRSGGSVSYVHVNRRIREAIIFLYGEYYRAYGNQDCKTDIGVLSNHDLPYYKVVIFQANGGAFSSGKSDFADYYVLGDDYGSFPEVTREGFTFVGWQITKISNSSVSDGEVLSAGDIVEYNLEATAIWEENNTETEPDVTEPEETDPEETEPEETEPEETEPEETEPEETEPEETEPEETEPEETEPVEEFPFTDVPESAWYRDEVEYVYEKGLMQGTTDTEFSPSGTMTRGMMVTVLYRMAGEPAVSEDQVTSFEDVPANKYYTKAVAWASANGIVKGTSDTTFTPNRNVTRQEAVTFFYRYCVQYLGMTDYSQKDLSMFEDADSVSKFAFDAICWAVDAGILNGVKEGEVYYLRPTKTLTRAEGAALVMRVDEIL